MENRETVDPSTLRPLALRTPDVTAEDIVDAMWVAFRQARAGDITAQEGQQAVTGYWTVADAAGLSRAVADVIVRRSEAVRRGQR